MKIYFCASPNQNWLGHILLMVQVLVGYVMLFSGTGPAQPYSNKPERKITE